MSYALSLGLHGMALRKQMRLVIQLFYSFKKILLVMKYCIYFSPLLSLAIPLKGSFEKYVSFLGELSSDEMGKVIDSGNVQRNNKTYSIEIICYSI
jgi:hypothetical protein